MNNKRSLLAALALMVLPGALFAQNAPVSDNATAPSVESQALDAPNPGAAGLLTAQMTGLPVSLWQGSDPQTLQALFTATKPAVPALRSLMRTLVLAEAEPPAGGAAGVAHLAARLDWLMREGAVEEAKALLDIVGRDAPELFRRWADLSLLLGNSGAACAELAARPSVSDDLSLRVFCVARAGDWDRAALILGTGETLGQLTARQADLLARFLEPALAEELPSLLPPVRPTPLEFRLFEALGEPLPTAPLPPAFAVLDLGGDNGWRAQVEAAERLARVGSLPPNRLLGLYTRQRPAASGGVWDRVAAVQRFETSLDRGAPDVVGPALVRVWPQMVSARLLVPFAELFAEPTAEIALTGRAARLQTRLGFLSPAYEQLALRNQATDGETLALAAIARGEAPAAGGLAGLPHLSAVRAGFETEAAPPVLARQLQEGRLGEVILRAIALFASGADGNGADLTDALATFRAVGLEDSARRAALEVMILDAERARR